ncbi:MAG: hypothetical protein F4071_06995 [Acidimicrobiaceae bacterium]|nr:hypothetical protein [Acidimicrobiaceae bacterium]
MEGVVSAVAEERVEAVAQPLSLGWRHRRRGGGGWGGCGGGRGWRGRGWGGCGRRGGGCRCCCGRRGRGCGGCRRRQRGRRGGVGGLVARRAAAGRCKKRNRCNDRPTTAEHGGQPKGASDP